ncbi:MAG: formylmethanofuran dehydrogenase subunit B [Gemmataceae bacterium]
MIEVFTDVACTVCGCVCDDLTVTVDAGRVVRSERACRLAEPWFLGQSAGQPASAAFDDAVSRAAELLSAARNPLIYGLSRSTTEGQRAATALADRLGATIDTTASTGHAPSILALQQVGESTCTLGEVANRADLVIFWGSDPVVTHPRHLERYSADPVGRFVPEGRAGRHVVVVDVAETETAKVADRFVRVDLLVGPGARDGTPAVDLDFGLPACVAGRMSAMQTSSGGGAGPNFRLFSDGGERASTAMAFQARAQWSAEQPSRRGGLGRASPSPCSNGIDSAENAPAGLLQQVWDEGRLPALRELAARMKACRFGVIFFGGGLVKGPHAHRTIEALLQLVTDLSRHTRFYARRMRRYGDVAGADSVLAWQTGYPFGVNLARGYPRYNPGEFTGPEMLSRGEADCCLLVGSGTVADFPPAALDHLRRIPVIALDPPGAEPPVPATVRFTTAVYGVHRPGTAYRMDEVPIPLRVLLPTSLPSDADVLTAILGRIPGSG